MPYESQKWKTGNLIERMDNMDDALIDIAEGEGSATTVDWGDVTGKPTTFAPVTHTHAYADITGTPNIPTVPSAMTASEASTGTSTTARTITAKVLNDLIDAKIAEASAG